MGLAEKRRGHPARALRRRMAFVLSRGRRARPRRRTSLLYRAGVVLHDLDRPHQVLYRSPEPLLGPVTFDERFGTVDDVVFPTGIDVREDGSYDVYYGAADAKISLARFELATRLRSSQVGNGGNMSNRDAGSEPTCPHCQHSVSAHSQGKCSQCDCLLSPGSAIHPPN